MHLDRLLWISGLCFHACKVDEIVSLTSKFSPWHNMRICLHPSVLNKNGLRLLHFRFRLARYQLLLLTRHLFQSPCRCKFQARHSRRLRHRNSSLLRDLKCGYRPLRTYIWKLSNPLRLIIIQVRSHRNQGMLTLSPMQLLRLLHLLQSR